MRGVVGDQSDGVTRVTLTNEMNARLATSDGTWGTQMDSIRDEDYQKHLAPLISDGFTLDPPGYERLNQWTHVLMHIINARANFQWVLGHPVVLGDLDNSLQQQAFFVSGIMAYGRCPVQWSRS